jgi:hypothetical protein
MNILLQPWCLLLAMLSEWVRQEQEKVIEFQKAEIQVLMEKLGKKRILLNDDHRRRLAVKGKVLGRKKLQEIASVAQADTILRWHRELVVQNGYSRPRGNALGRPRTDQAIVDLALRMAAENVSWGYKRIQGALDNLGHRISSSTVANILKAHGVDPAPERRRQLPWRVFLMAHWDALRGVDLSTIFAGVRGLLTCLREGVVFVLNRCTIVWEASALSEGSNQSVHRSVAFGPPQDPAGNGDQTDGGPFDGPRPLCIRPPPSWLCPPMLDNQLFGRRAA